MRNEIEHIRQLILKEETVNPGSMTKILANSMTEENVLSSLNEFLKAGELPVQTFNGQQFSQFPLTILNERNLHLDLYHWSDSHTSIHDHNFHGAFKVMKGTYRQKLYSFNSRLKVFDWLEIGELTLLDDKTLLPGSVVTIPHGSDFIHSNEHSNGECVTVCLRTALPEGPIHTYIMPSLKLTHTAVDQRSQKVLDYIQYLAIDYSKNELKIKELFGSLEKNHLFQVVFSYNVPKWLTRAELRSLAYKILKDTFQAEPWFMSVRDSFVAEKLGQYD